MEATDVPFTVLIPTRERAGTLRAAIQSCLNQQVSNLRVVVSDNCSGDDTAAVVSGFTDQRLEYVNPGRRLSMSANFEFALEQFRDGYVMHLGDDDGLLPFALQRVSGIIRETGAKAVTTSGATYYWPNTVDDMISDRLIYSTKAGYELRSTTDIIRKVIRFERGYTQLPSTYNSFIHKDVIEKAKRGGKYYHSRTPDSFSGFVNASLVDQYAYSRSPFSLIGISSRSNGISQLWQSDRSESRLYEAESDLPFHEKLVYAPSIEIIVAEAFLQACGSSETLKGVALDIPRLCRVALQRASPWKWGEVRNAVLQIHQRNGLAAPTLPDGADAGGTLMRRSALLLSKAERLLKRLADGYKVVNCRDFGVETVEAASWLLHYRLCSAHAGYDNLLPDVKRWLTFWQAAR